MKEFIFNNYDLRVDRIYLKDNNYYFFINSNKIYIIKYKGDEKYLDDLVKITNNLYYKKINVNTFIINSNNKYYTKKKDYYIILLKENEIQMDLKLEDVLKFSYFNVNLKSYNILDEWAKEIDTIEKELIEYNDEYKDIQNSVDFFIGLGENAIELMSDYEQLIESNNLSIGHKLSFKLFESNVINNPFTFIKVNRMYDISNYIKYNFFINNINYNEIENIFKSCTDYEKVYLFACLMYPSTYFDLIKNVLLKNETENKVQFYIKNIEKYMLFISNCKKYVNNNENIKLISWIN